MLDRFAGHYERARAPVMKAIERQVCGCDYGGNSWTTREQAEQMAARLKLRRGLRLLELGAGSGWPGLHMARISRCEIVLVDIPLSGLKLAAERIAGDRLAENAWIAAADAAILPFPDASFDAISHSDLLCCLDQKPTVLETCRRVICRDGTMVFTVISVASGLSAVEYDRAVANGPDFIETETPYRALLSQTGWSLVDRLDITSAYGDSCARQIRADESNKAALVALIGDEVYVERLAYWRSKLAAINEGLVRRELFIATPNPEHPAASDGAGD